MIKSKLIAINKEECPLHKHKLRKQWAPKYTLGCFICNCSAVACLVFNYNFYALHVFSNTLKLFVSVICMDKPFEAFNGVLIKEGNNGYKVKYPLPLKIIYPTNTN